MTNQYEHQYLLAQSAANGNRESLETLLLEVKNLIYNLSVKMLFSKEDAEDATQDILIKVFMNLKQYQGKSKFSTWVYAIAKNHLLTTRKKRAESQPISFDLMSEDLSRTTNNDKDTVTDSIIVADLKISCTQAMLLCLDREKRLMFILSRMFDINSRDGAKIFNISPQAYRKRLSRTTDKMKNF